MLATANLIASIFLLLLPINLCHFDMFSVLEHERKVPKNFLFDFGIIVSYGVVGNEKIFKKAWDTSKQAKSVRLDVGHRLTDLLKWYLLLSSKKLFIIKTVKGQEINGTEKRHSPKAEPFQENYSCAVL